MPNNLFFESPMNALLPEGENKSSSFKNLERKWKLFAKVPGTLSGVSSISLYVAKLIVLLPLRAYHEDETSMRWLEL